MYKYKLAALVFLLLTVTFFSWVYAQYIFSLSFEEIEISLLSKDGFIGLWKPGEMEYSFMLFLNVFAVIGLLFHLHFFRVFYVLVLIVVYGSLLFLGYSVLPPVNNFFSSIIALIEGMLLMFIFSNKEK